MHVQVLYMPRRRANDDDSELAELVEWCTTDGLHVSPHRKLAVHAHIKVIDGGLKSDNVTTKLNVVNINFQELLSSAQPDQLSFVGV